MIMSNYNAPQEISSWLDGVALPPEIRTVVYDEAVSLYSKLDENIPDVERKELAKAALMISCDPYSTALTVDMPKPRFNVMAEARKVTGILPAESIQKVDAMVALLKWEGAINNDDAKEFTDKTIEILSKYRKKIFIHTTQDRQ